MQGATQIREIHGDEVLLVFVDAPSRDEQRRRLEGRGDPPERVAQRLERGDAERDAAAALGMHVIVNDDLDGAVEALSALVSASRKP